MAVVRCSWILGLAVALVVAHASLPASHHLGALAAAGPSQAHAIQYGISYSGGRHFWVKATAREIYGDVMYNHCWPRMQLIIGYKTPAQWICRHVSNIGERIVPGRYGFWAEIWSPRTYRYGTW